MIDLFYFFFICTFYLELFRYERICPFNSFTINRFKLFLSIDWTNFFDSYSNLFSPLLWQLQIHLTKRRKQNLKKKKEKLTDNFFLKYLIVFLAPKLKKKKHFSEIKCCDYKFIIKIKWKRNEMK